MKKSRQKHIKVSKIGPRNVFLVGFMGTGKSAVGRELARKKKWHFVDLDELIELREKRPISEIFARDGEPYFRRIESRVLKEVAREHNFVVACGGGIVLDRANMAVMKETGMVVCLSATVPVILKRTCKEAHRPLLRVNDPRRQIELLLKLRAPYYALADKTINTSELSVKELAAKIHKITSNKK
jgi:shikimate kinase